MSKFSTKHPVLAIAFNGAKKKAFRRNSLIRSGVCAVAGTGLSVAFGFATLGLGTPVAVVASAAYLTGLIGVYGAYKALDAAEKDHQPKP